jgi:hypothetical protein
VKIVLVVGPVPRRDDDVTLDAGRPRRLRVGQLTLSDPVGPVGKIGVRRAAEQARERIRHHLARLPRLGASHPSLDAVLEVAELLRDGASGKTAELVTADALTAFEQTDPFDLRDIGRDVALAAELVLARHLHHGVPVDRRIILGRRGFVRCRYGGEIELFAGLAVDLRRIDKAVAADPYLVLGLGKIGQHITALIVRDHAAGEPRRQVPGFRDHPHSCLGAAGAPHHAADIVVVDGSV